MKTVILCGGKGTRLRELTDKIPKPLVEIGGKPILWHIMKLYASAGFDEFVLALGYKGELIQDYFKKNPEEWKITFVDTGIETNTGGRLKLVQKHIPTENFLVTYGDGVSSVKINEVIAHHKNSNAIATITCVRPTSQFGIVEINDKGLIHRFAEKPVLPHWVNGGFFVFNRKIFDFIGDNDVLEKEVFERLACEMKIAAFKFEGFWNCMDTFKDVQVLNEMWDSGKAHWKVWE